MELSNYLKQYQKLAIGFSGGVDSAYLLYAAKQTGCNIQAYFVKSQFQPEFELQDAQRLAKQLEVPLKIISLDVLQIPEVVENPVNRCYYCKKSIFSALKATALEDGYEVIADGTNASDQVADRAGMKALQELKIISPLRECGLTKTEIRQRSKEVNLFTWDKPAYACLATRIQTGQPIEAECLKKIELGEQKLMDFGFSDFRIRIIGNQAKIQLPEQQFDKFWKQRIEIVQSLKTYFESVVLDLEPR